MKPQATDAIQRTGWLGRRHGAARLRRDLITLPVAEPKRRHSRHATRNLQIESPVYGWAVDVSESGLCLESVTALLAGAEYLFRLRYGGNFLSLPGRVAWGRLARIETTRRGRVLVYRAGVELAIEGAESEWIRAIERLTGAALRL